MKGTIVTKIKEIIADIWAAIAFVRWLLAEKKKLETDTKNYLSDKRALDLRVWLRRMARALEAGEGEDFDKFPAWLKRICATTDIDNYAGKFVEITLGDVTQEDAQKWTGPAADRAKP